VNTVEERLARLALLKSQIASLESERKALQAEVMAEFKAQDATKMYWLGDDEGVWNTATLVEPTSVKFDETILRESLTDEQWSSVTKTVLDETALEDQVASGAIPMSAVEQCSTIVPRTPYLRFGTSRERER